jgi:hypothetical protein
MADNLNITNRSSSTGDAELKRLYAELRERDRRPSTRPRKVVHCGRLSDLQTLGC